MSRAAGGGMQLVAFGVAVAALAAVSACHVQNSDVQETAGATATGDAGPAECSDGDVGYTRCVWPADCPSTPYPRCAGGHWQCPQAPAACVQSTGTFGCGGASCKADAVCVATDQSGRGATGYVQHECRAIPDGCAANPTCACVSGAFSNEGTLTPCNSCDYSLRGGGTTVRCAGY